MNVESSREVSHIKARTINEATGTDFIVIIKGQSRSSRMGKRAAIKARINPMVSPRKNPATIFTKLLERERKKPSSLHSVNNLAITSIGVGKRNSSFTIIAAICHTPRANMTEGIRFRKLTQYKKLFFFLALHHNP